MHSQRFFYHKQKSSTDSALWFVGDTLSEWIRLNQLIPKYTQVTFKWENFLTLNSHLWARAVHLIFSDVMLVEYTWLARLPGPHGHSLTETALIWYPCMSECQGICNPLKTTGTFLYLCTNVDFSGNWILCFHQNLREPLTLNGYIFWYICYEYKI